VRWLGDLDVVHLVFAHVEHVVALVVDKFVHGVDTAKDKEF
jgi:hypothetical protein